MPIMREAIVPQAAQVQSLEMRKTRIRFCSLVQACLPSRSVAAERVSRALGRIGEARRDVNREVNNEKKVSPPCPSTSSGSSQFESIIYRHCPWIALLVMTRE